MAQEAMRDILMLRVENWVRYLRANGGSKGHCFSIEHRYRSPQWGHWDSAPPQIKGDIDILDAQRVEDATMLMDRKCRRLLKLHFLRGLSSRRVEMQLKIKFGTFDEMKEISLSQLQNSLKRLENSANPKALIAIIYENLNRAFMPTRLDGAALSLKSRFVFRE